MRWAYLAAAVVAMMAVLSRAEPASADEAAAVSTWDPAAAGRFLDDRLAWWRQWPRAERDQGTRCVSCHTSLPHVLAMPALRRQSGSARQSTQEMAMFGDVIKRVYLWDEVEPFYPDRTRGVPKSAESRGVEGVLNALILATRDQERGYFGPDTRQAFANMWALQMETGPQKGSFTWLNFHLEPFESPTATYWGATLAALAVARAPDDYAAEPAISRQVDALRAYLRTGLADQSLYVRALLLWAGSQLDGVLQPEESQAIVEELCAIQRADGGWSLPSLASWQRTDRSLLPQESDGYATAIVALVLREAGVPPTSAPLVKARQWLAAHQDTATGAVSARSINKDRQAGSDAYLFMTDQATGIAALAMRP